MEYCGGVKGVKVGTAEMLDNAPSISSSRIPDISTVRNIVYGANGMTVRKASGIGPGRKLNYSNLFVPINMELTESFDP